MAFSVYIRQAIENGQVIFPGNKKAYGFCLTCDEHKPGDKLKCLQCIKEDSTSAFRFSAQYMNNPIDEEAIEFKSAWLIEQPITGKLASDLDKIPGYLTVDPAFRLNQTSDYTGFAITKVGPDNIIYVLEAYQKKTTPEGVIDEILHLVDRYNIRTVGIETVGAQLVLLTPLKHEMKKRNNFFKIDELKTSTRETKAARIRGLIPYYANGRIIHRYGLDMLKDQLIQFPRNIHDDIIDALAYQVDYWKEFKKTGKRRDDAPYWSLNWFLKQDNKPRSSMDELFKEFKRR